MSSREVYIQHKGKVPNTLPMPCVSVFFVACDKNLKPEKSGKDEKDECVYWKEMEESLRS